jgi:hypothetical protein
MAEFVTIPRLCGFCHIDMPHFNTILWPRNMKKVKWALLQYMQSNRKSTQHKINASGFSLSPEPWMLC